MALNLMFITNDSNIAKLAENSGVDLIFIDLEINGKVERQGHLDTVISRHHMEDIGKVKNVLEKSKLLVRINPIFGESQDEIDKVIDNGADIIMLPFFKTKEEIHSFVKFVNNRVKTMLLLETPDAVENIGDILGIKGIDYIHIGLNDLHLGYGMKFMFELLSNGTIEKLCNKIKEKGIPYGFGGIAQIGKGTLPAEYIIGEHHRLGSQMAILSRSFYNTKNQTNYDVMEKEFVKEIKKIKNYETYLEEQGEEFFIRNREKMDEIIQRILK